MKKIWQRIGAVAIPLVLLAFSVLQPALDSHAMPVFARKYQTSCVTCHATFPRLNAVGTTFLLNGYKFEDDEQYRKEEPVELGDEAYKKVWPNSYWPNEIPGKVPLSFAAKFLTEIKAGNDTPTRESDVTLVLPHEVELAFAGSMGDNLAAYGDMIYVQEDYGSSTTYSWVMLKAWIEFSDIVGPENLVNLRIGSVGMHTMGLFTATDEASIDMFGYEFNAWLMPLIEAEKIDELIEFRGNPFRIQPQPGIELFGFGDRWLAYAGVVNGNIERPLGGDPEFYDFDGVFFSGAGKNTKNKDFYGGASYKFGGMGFDGTGSKEDNILAKTPDFWRDDSLTLSIFGYTGTGEILVDRYDDPAATNPGDPSTRLTFDDDFYRLALGALWKYKRMALNAGYQWGHNDNPFGSLSDDSVDTNAWFVEAWYFAYPWLIPFARFESLTFDGIPDAWKTQEKEDRDILKVGVKGHIRANVSLTAEYNYFTNRPSYSCMSDEMVYLMLSMTF